MTTSNAGTRAQATAQAASAARLRVTVPSVADRVAAELRLQLAEGVLLPGTRLTESTIAEDLGVSRNTVREAFAELAAERLVVRLPNRGIFVASLGPGDVHDVYTVRRAIEVSAISTGGSPERVAAVRAAVEEGKAAAAAGDEEALGTANQHFHGAIVALAEAAGWTPSCPRSSPKCACSFTKPRWMRTSTVATSTTTRRSARPWKPASWTAPGTCCWPTWTARKRKQSAVHGE